jgi:hypothetical protein
LAISSIIKLTISSLVEATGKSDVALPAEAVEKANSRSFHS